MDPHEIILYPHITEKTRLLAYGDPRIKDEKEIVRKYTFIVSPRANKIQIKSAVEAIYNDGKKDKEKIEVVQVATINVKGRNRRVGQRKAGKTALRKKAIVTLAAGQVLEDFGV
ncbi:50S ribosomal protein L23 [bacterium]|jgi:large subunit ribosomal protein L23|nr:50S ribosomal protein L23 [Armatimonadetes bacterium Uphvl-Ar1]MBA4293240.1 50S ribosomal protein L23 [bacterium]